MEVKRKARSGKKKASVRSQRRKAPTATVLRKRLVENKVEEAEASFAFLVAVRNNAHEPIARRLEAAKEILNRVLGKPTEMQANENEELYKQHFERIRQVIFNEQIEK